MGNSQSELNDALLLVCVFKTINTYPSASNSLYGMIYQPLLTSEADGNGRHPGRNRRVPRNLANVHENLFNDPWLCLLDAEATA
jgi:hypothetical protein